ncbi:hypothetical protein LguiA_024136 [Lonicera macranthoides]
MIRKTTVLDVMRRILQVHESLQRIRERKLVNFIEWGPASIQVALLRKSPYVQASLLINILSVILCSYTFIFFLNMKHQDKDLSEFDESREVIESLVDEYQACEFPDYIKGGMEVYTLLACPA